MPHSIKNNLNIILTEIKKEAEKWHENIPTLVAVSKKQNINKIIETINLGQIYFAENIIQETKNKWPELLVKYPQIKLHFIGHLQRNKVSDALELFDMIETIDNEKLALEISKKITNKSKTKSMLIQVNIGEEKQKYGISPNETKEFIAYTINELKLPIKGLMCIPPINENPSIYFAYLRKIAKDNNLKYLSQGMSSDYLEAIRVGTNQVRIGSKLFGIRDS
jgi:pyridoxal phosphate enzyme (YggS family)